MRANGADTSTMSPTAASLTIRGRKIPATSNVFGPATVGSWTVPPGWAPSRLAAISLSPTAPCASPVQKLSGASGPYSAVLYQSPGVTPSTSRDSAPDEIVDRHRDDTLRPPAASVIAS